MHQDFDADLLCHSFSEHATGELGMPELLTPTKPAQGSDSSPVLPHWTGDQDVLNEFDPYSIPKNSGAHVQAKGKVMNAEWQDSSLLSQSSLPPPPGLQPPNGTPHTADGLSSELRNKANGKPCGDAMLSRGTRVDSGVGTDSSRRWYVEKTEPYGGTMLPRGAQSNLSGCRLF